MARIRKGKNPRPVAVRWLAVKKRRPTGDGGAANGEPHSVKHVIEFPKPPVDDVISDRIIFDVGGDRFEINWTAEIEQLPLAGPVAVQRKSRLKSDRRLQ